jgi:hypothetical protein
MRTWILETYKLRARKPLIEKRQSLFKPLRKDEVLDERLRITRVHLLRSDPEPLCMLCSLSLTVSHVYF